MKHVDGTNKLTVKEKTKKKSSLPIDVIADVKITTKQSINKVDLRSRQNSSINSSKTARNSPKVSPCIPKAVIESTVQEIPSKNPDVALTLVKAKTKAIAETAKNLQTKSCVSNTLVKQAKISSRKTKPTGAVEKVVTIKSKAEKFSQTSVKVIENQSSKSVVNALKAKTHKIEERIVPLDTVNRKPKKIQTTVPTKIIVEVAKPDASPMIATKSPKPKTIVSAEPLTKQKRATDNTVPAAKIDAFNNVDETAKVQLPKPKNKKAKPISSAVFRGKKERYDFKVFSLDEVFEPIPAVYIISKRVTDKRKKGHHALVCIGATTSVFDEMKRHRKGKCVKKHRANVVSILPETDEKTRLKIETDLKAAHAVICNLD